MDPGNQQAFAVAAGQQLHRVRDRDEPPVNTAVPSALPAGSASAPCSCARNPTNPIVAATNTAASAATMMVRSLPRAAGAGDIPVTLSLGIRKHVWCR